jgi:hypothetical protein
MRVRAIAVLLVLFTATASAENSVDWSAYMEKPGDKPLVVHKADSPVVDAPVSVASSGKATKASKKKAAAKKSKARTTKARAKAKSHRK